VTGVSHPVIRPLSALAVGLMGYWTLIFLVQRQVAFPAPSPRGAPARPPDARQVWLESAAGRTEAWLLPPLGRGAGLPPVMLFAHGNGELIDYWPGEFEEPRRAGMAVLLVEYPGYGRSGGHPSERSIGQVMAAAFDWAAAQPDLDGRRIIAYGRSLGGGAMGLLVRSRRPAALVLESSFTSTRPFARRMGAPGFLVRDPFDNLLALRRYDGPVLVIHGEHDDIIPVDHGRALAEAARVDLHLMACGHNDCPRPWPLVLEFLARAGLLPGFHPGTP
jgi:uncharacterized protein